MKATSLLFAAFLAACASPLFAQTGEIIVESSPDGQNFASYQKVDGAWLESTAKSKAPGLKGTAAMYKSLVAGGAARFAPDIPADGKYDVYLTYPDSGNASGVIHKVHSASGDKEIVLDQNGRAPAADPAPNVWIPLGTYEFKKGTDGFVEVRDPGTGKGAFSREPNTRMYADAVKFVPNTTGQEIAAAVNKPVEDAGVPPAQASAVAAAPPVATPAAAPGMPPMPDLGAPPPAPPTTANAPKVDLPPLAAAAPTAPKADLPPLAAAAAGQPNLPASASLPPLPAAASAAATPALPSLQSAAASQASPVAPSVNETPAPVASSEPALPPLGAATAAATAPALPPLPGSVAPATGGAPLSAPALPPLPGAPASPPMPAPPAPPADAASGTLPPIFAAPGASTAATTAPGMMSPPPPGAPAATAGIPASPSLAPPPLPPGMPGLPPTGALPPLAVPPPIPGAGESAPPLAPPATAGVPGASDLSWVFDIGAAQTIAEKSNKPILVFFTAEGNKRQAKYEAEFFSNPAVRSQLDRFVLMRSDFPANTRYAYKLGVYGAGNIVVIDRTEEVKLVVDEMPSTPDDLAKKLEGVK